MLVRTSQSRFLLAGTSVLVALLAGCRVGPRYHPPTPPQITAPNYKESTVNFQNAPGWKVASPQEGMIRGNWWEIFHEPELNALEEQLNLNNQSIKASFENFMAARAVVKEAQAQFWPTITAAPSWRRTRSSANQTFSTAATTGRTASLWNLPLDVSWTPDLWGQIRNAVRQSEYNAQVSAADLQLETLTEQAALAQFFFEIRGQDMLQKILNDTVAADQRSLNYAQAQYSTGIGDYISVEEAATTLQSAQASAAAAALLRAQYEHAIAMLTGKIATDFSMPVRPLIYTPPAIPTGVPSQLLERRPDVAGAERTLAAANATIGIGYGAFFPAVTINASGGFESALFKHLFDISSRTWSIGPAVSQVVFNGWLYKAQLHQYEAIYNGDLALYRQTVLNAFQQVEDSLAATRIDSQEIANQQQAVDSAENYMNIELERYNTGVDPYLDVMIAQNTLLAAQATLNADQVSEMLASVTLIENLGGGWDRSQLPTPTQTAAKTTNADYQMQH
jgi:NodT family efflux transporter outer membrane factor (OMF) lipoprotein